MFTGENNILDVGQISEWNFMSHANESVYPDYCGQLNGSAGEFFPPGRDKTYVDFFTPDLCRYKYECRQNAQCTVVEGGDKIYLVILLNW